MKVRILNNSIRYRLRQHEVEQFQSTGVVTEVTAFGFEPEDQLSFTLQMTDTPKLGVDFVSNAIKIWVPQQLANEWTGTEQVGFDAKVETAKGKTISILVEKDFVCLDSPEEDNVGAYPNPKAC